VSAATSETIDRPAPTEPPAEAWHALTGEQVAATLHVDPAAGLSGEEVKRRAETYGPNRFAAR
jgi:magnesium-transporting ATPase (P-type)